MPDIDIKALRDRLLLSQADLARKVGVHPLTVSRWERGVYKPDLRAQRKLRALEASK